MTVSEPRTLTAGERESGTLCACCHRAIVAGDPTAICRSCGAVHHATCWEANRGCGAYECAQSAAVPTAPESIMKITNQDLAAAEPLPTRAPAATDGADPSSAPAAHRPRWNRTAVAAFVVALLGIPLFGLITGLIAVVVACVALVSHSHGRRGLTLAVLAIVIGLADVVGWAVGLSTFFGMPHSMVALDELTLDPESLKELPAKISRAMRANVVIESAAGLGRSALGSGVVLKIDGGVAHIITNRHTVDMNYAGSERAPIPDLSSLRNIQVITVGQSSVPARVEWIAPHGVDLAIISAPVNSGEVEAAHWNADVSPHVGDSVFAVGNPHGLGWTHSAGDISQIRRRTHNDYSFRILQTTAAINPGNSGGGLYDAEGRLIGINTLTGDKRFAEGLGFSIALPTLMDLLPERFDLPRQNPPAEKKAEATTETP